MNSYRYRATDDRGEAATGTITADSRIDARRRLVDRGMSSIEDVSLADIDDGDLLDLSATAPTSWRDRLLAYGQLEVNGGVAQEQLLQFTRMLSMYAHSGVPLVAGLDTLARTTAHARLSAATADISRRVRSGEQLSVAFAAHPRIFGPMYVATLRAGETAGDLGDALDRLAVHIDNERETRNRATSLMVYPSIILSLAAAAALMLTAVVFPRLIALFQTTSEQLPWWPRLLLAGSEFVRGAWPALLGGSIIALAVLLTWQRTTAGRRARHRWMLRLPLVRRVTQAMVYERFLRALAALLRAGVSLPDALEVAGAASGNSVYADAIHQVHTEVLRGTSLSTALAGTELFDPSIIQLARAGEASGHMDDQLAVLGDFYAGEARRRIDRAAQVGEPLLLLVAAIGVGSVAIALVQVMYGSYQYIPGF